MTQPTVVARAKGLFTHPNPIGETIPLGAFTVADDVVIDREDIVETRRGLKLDGTAFSLGGGSINKFFNYRDRLIASYASKLAYDSDGNRTFVDYSGTFDPPTGALRIRAAQANKNLYLTTSTGIRKIDALAGTPSAAGMYKALDGTGATTGVAGWMANNVQAGYRVVWGIKDANNNKILGAPSQRIIVSNSSGGTRNVALIFTIPSGITTSHFYQVYRSGQSTGIADEPNDELQLIVEKNPTAGEIVALSVTYTDETPDSLRGASLYTNPSQQGIAQANDAPPLARDIAAYKNQMLFANVISKHRAYLTMISVGGTGLVNGDTITIAGVVYTGAGAENSAIGNFLVTTGGTAAQNIDATAKSLIRVINQYASNTLVYAYYLTGFSDLPGQILIEERSLGGSTFYAISSRGSAFSPALPSSGTTYASSNDVCPNRVYVAKPGQPEAVPLLNYVDVGSALADILRIFALRGSTFVIKTDGVFRITGETISDLRVEAFDTTTKIIGEETAAEVNNAVVAYSNQGAVKISDSGVEIISRSIEGDLLKLKALSNFSSLAFGVSYESDRKFILSVPSLAADTITTRQYVYNFITSSWTRWSRRASCGLVNQPEDRLYFGQSEDSKVSRERKDYGATDYADEEISVNITSIDGLDITLDTVTGVEVGMSLAQLDGTDVLRDSVITDINGLVVTVTDELSWTGGPAGVYTPITSIVRYAPLHAGNPAILHQFSWLVFLFAGADFDELLADIFTDKSPGTDEISLVPQDAQPWGSGDWGGGGEIGWGGGPLPLQAIPATVPREKQQANWLIAQLTGAQAFKSFALAGLATFKDDVASVPAYK